MGPMASMYHVTSLECWQIQLAKALKRAPEVIWQSNGEAGDGQDVCSVCGEDILDDKPHSAADCFRNATDQADGYISQLADEMDKHADTLDQLATAQARIKELEERNAEILKVCHGWAEGHNSTMEHIHRVEQEVDKLLVKFRIPQLKEPQ